MLNEFDMEEERRNDMLKLLRQHKHHNSSKFGMMFSEPIEMLFRFMLDQSELFTPAERKEIAKLYTRQCSSTRAYKMLGYDVEDQLNERDSIVTEIVSCNHLIKKYSKHENVKHNIQEALKRADGETGHIVAILNGLESATYGEPEVFKLRDAINSVFKSQEYIVGDEKAICYERYFGPLADVNVKMNKQAFIEYVLQNIEKNLLDHAFPSDNIYRVPQFTYRKWYSARLGKVISYLNDALNKIFSHKVQAIPEEKEKNVRIWFKETNEPNRICIEFENNGEPFDGDMERILSGEPYSTGNGSGLGMVAIKQFIEENNGSVRFESHNDSEYKVKLKIFIPIYERLDV